MKLITRFDLACNTLHELRVLRCAVFNALVRSEENSAERRNALASS
jgi:hypothetical protein